MHRLVSTSVLVAIASLMASADAVASGFAIRENCAEGLGTTFAGAGSLADDPCTVFNNPAGMTRLDGTQLEIGATPVFSTINFQGTITGAAVNPGYSNNNGNNAGRPALVPDIYGVTHITPDLSAGIAVTSPFGLPVKYNSAWVGRYNVIQAEALSTDINPNLAYKFSDKLSLAAGLSAQYFTYGLSQAINQGFVGSTDALARFKGDNWAMGYNFGVLWQPLPDTRIGVTYRSKVDHKLSGDFDVLNLNPALGGVLVSGPTTADLALPATAGVSVTHELTSQWTIVSDVQWTQWSSFKTFNLVGPTALAYFNAELPGQLVRFAWRHLSSRGRLEQLDVPRRHRLGPVAGAESVSRPGSSRPGPLHGRARLRLQMERADQLRFRLCPLFRVPRQHERQRQRHRRRPAAVRHHLQRQLPAQPRLHLRVGEVQVLAERALEHGAAIGVGARVDQLGPVGVVDHCPL